MSGGATVPEPRAAPDGGAVVIRLMTDESDISTLVALGREASAQSRYANAPFREERLVTFFRDALQLPKTNGILLAEREGEVVGCLFANASRLLFADVVSAQALFFYVRSSARASRAAIRLLKAYEVWARNRRAVELNIHITTGAENGQSIARLLARKGYRSAGRNMYSNG